jgi:hypothetical protein
MFSAAPVSTLEGVSGVGGVGGSFSSQPTNATANKKLIK